MLGIDDVIAERFRLLRVLGHGGMSDVYEAMDESIGNRVALKIVRSADAGAAQRFAQEVRALELLDHPSLVRLLDSGSLDGQAFLVMELVEGENLNAELARGPLGGRRTAQVGTRLAEGLAYAHERGVVHRDVKPSNILVSTSGDAQLSDFGIARLLDDATMTVTGTTLGTAAYMAPEQLEDHDVSASADVWSLGMVLLECLVGRRIYEGSPSQVVARRIAGPVPIPADLPVPWKLLLGGMLDHRPDQRLSASSVADLLSTPPFRADWWPPTPGDDITMVVPFDLSGLASASPDATLLALGPSGPAAARHQRPPSRSRRSSSQVALVVAVIGGSLLFGYLLNSGASQPPKASTTTSPPSTTTTISVAARGPAAFGALSQELAKDVLAGIVPASLGQQLTTQVGQTLVDAASNNSAQATTDLQQAFNGVASAIAGGSLAPLVGTRLESDLTSIATSEGLTLPNASPTTVPAPNPGQGDGNGHGHGNN